MNLLSRQHNGIALSSASFALYPLPKALPLPSAALPEGQNSRPGAVYWSREALTKPHVIAATAPQSPIIYTMS